MCQMETLPAIVNVNREYNSFMTNSSNSNNRQCVFNEPVDVQTTKKKKKKHLLIPRRGLRSIFLISMQIYGLIFKSLCGE